MTPHDAVKAAAEELTGMVEAQKRIEQMMRLAERRAGEADDELNALRKVHGAVAIVIESHQRRLLELRALVEKK